MGPCFCDKIWTHPSHLVFTSMWTPPTHYYLEFSGWVAYMESHLKWVISFSWTHQKLTLKSESKGACGNITPTSALCQHDSFDLTSPTHSSKAHGPHGKTKQNCPSNRLIHKVPLRGLGPWVWSFYEIALYKELISALCFGVYFESLLKLFDFLKSSSFCFWKNW